LTVLTPVHRPRNVIRSLF